MLQARPFATSRAFAAYDAKIEVLSKSEIEADLSHYLIRKYVAEDISGVLSCWENANKIAHPFLADDFVNQIRIDIPQIYLPNAETWVADNCGRVIGFISLLNNEIGALFVEPSFHRNGIGFALVKKAQELRGDLEVEVFELNRVGRDFYAKCGFTFLGEYFHEESGHKVLRLNLDQTSR